MNNELNDKQVKFLQVFVKKMANVKQTCKAIGISRATYYNWVDNLDTFKKEVESIREGLYDDAESVLYEKIFVQKDTTSLIFFMKTKMKHRGYTERQEVDMKSKVEADINSFNKSARYTPEELEAEIERYKKLAGRK